MEEGDGRKIRIPNYLGCVDVKAGEKADFAALRFDDQLFIVFTQFQKIGTLVSVKCEEATVGIPSPVFSSQVLLGKDEVEIHAIAKLLARKIRISDRILFGLSLKDYHLSDWLLKSIDDVTSAINNHKFS